MSGQDIPLFMLGVAASLVLFTFCLLVVALMILVAFSFVLGAIDLWQSWKTKP